MKDISLGILIIAIMVCIFMMGRQSVVQQQAILAGPDNSNLYKTIDSLKSVNKKIEDSIKVCYSKIDSLSKLKVINKKKVEHGIIEIKRFTPDARIRWNDSVLRANGLK